MSSSFPLLLRRIVSKKVFSINTQCTRSLASFSLPPLPYDKNALNPFISEETLDYHYGKHHATYVTKLNGFAESDISLQQKTLEEIIKTSSGGIFNNAAQIWNHTFYWNSLSPASGGAPHGKIEEFINRDFGSFSAFQKAFSDACVNHFGSGKTPLHIWPPYYIPTALTVSPIHFRLLPNAFLHCRLGVACSKI